MARKAKTPKPERVTVTRYYDQGGKQCKKSEPGAKKRTRQSETYFVRLKNPQTGKRIWHSLETCEESSAWKRLSEILAQHARDELLGSTAASISSTISRLKPMSEHITDWIADLETDGKTGVPQLKLLESRLRNLQRIAEWEQITDIDRRSASKALAKLQSQRVRGMEAEHAGRGNRTRNHYLRHLKQFCKWAVEDGRLTISPVAGIDPLNTEIDKRRARRSPSVSEVAKLMAYLEGEEDGEVTAKTICSLTGPQRALGYRLCMATGFRAKELRLLTPVSFDLSNGTVTCRAAYGKNRKLAVQALPSWLVEELRVWLGANKPLWGRFPKKWPGRLLSEDQQACGIEHCIEGPSGKLWFDFHSLRHWYCSWAANQPGISPKTLQTMARHADSRLTMEIYAKPQDDEVRRTLDRLPDLRSLG